MRSTYGCIDLDLSCLWIIDQRAHIAHNPPSTAFSVAGPISEPSMDNRDDEGERGCVNRVDKDSLEQHVEAGPCLAWGEIEGGSRGQFGPQKEYWTMTRGMRRRPLSHHWGR